jgi:hypothetical protein
MCQLHVSSYDSSKDINLDSPSAISKSKFDAFSNGGLALSL